MINRLGSLTPMENHAKIISAPGSGGFVMLYFILSALFLTVLPSLAASLPSNAKMIDGNSAMYVLYVLWCIAAYALTAYGYARIFLSQTRVKRPKSLIGFYAPMLLTLCVGMAMHFSDITKMLDDYNTPDIYMVLILVNFWQFVISIITERELPQLNADFLLPIAHIIAMLAAWQGYRITRRKEQTEPLTVPVKQCAAALAAVTVFTFGCAYGRWYRRMTTPSVNGRENTYFMRYAAVTSEGYGFPYEGGWSSVDLWPYHAENPKNTLAILDEPSAFVISEQTDMPILDGAEAAYPVYAAFANACYENIAEIQAGETGKKPVAFTNTIEAYKSLLSGDVDIFFGAELSDEQLRMAEEAGKTLVLTPIAREAFVFFVSADNPVDGLTSEQIRNIYSGKTKNWLFLGGGFMPILAYQRPENSGSQTRMQHFMGETPLKAPLEIEFEISMYGTIQGVADYENRPNAIGYSFRYYATQMAGDAEDNNIKLLTLDGIAILNVRYPMSCNLMSITLADNPNPKV